MIEVSHLTKEYGDFKAVDDISFKLVPGEILGFLGPNGAGKSTTMKMLTGFLRPTSGQVSIKGFDIASQSIEAQGYLGYLPEGAPAYEEMTPVAFLRFIAAARGLAGKALETGIEQAIETMSLQAVLQQKIETLSKGYKRRVGLAQAILHDPDVLILDEPTDGLDPNQKHQVREMIKGLSADKIVIVSTHILEEVSAVCNRAIVLSHGRIAADATPADLLSRSVYNGSVSLTVGDLNYQEIESQLQQLSGVKEIQVVAGQFTLFPNDQSEGLFSRVFELARDQNWQVSSIYSDQGRLDDVFRDLTQGEAS